MESYTSDKWRISVPLSTEMSTVRGASLGTLIASGIAVASVAVLGPTVVIPSLITIAGGSTGAVIGYLSRKRHEPTPDTSSSSSQSEIRKIKS